MKKIILFPFLVLGITTISSAQKAKLKKHHCTSACVNGNHMYAHGEKGHACTDACKKMEAGKMNMKDHVCTAACKDGKHMYAHGEKGHVCTEACMKKM
jgi:hypothetical protein